MSDFDKLKASIAYVCDKEQKERGALDHVKLNKVMWYSDAAIYMTEGKTITGGKYIRKPRGPVSKYMTSAVSALQRDSILTSGKTFDADRGVWYNTYEVTGETGKGSALDVMAILSDHERSVLDRAFHRVCLDYSADSISERTHGEVWELAADGEEIPLYAMYAERLGNITRDDLSRVFGN